ncbi:unnamed protein product [Acanthoscelides obtectus]|uniref:Uncharacterized protein n=1 Tax=Acanthoscelides obtectus TaxID=200917 RepID=A0A9P0VTL0_ACAOB|nr:unnamed protein product [Acanthoscelides obtectus]CAK1656459.1 hypothetical protein AOBTE_LOCUS19721 [Acanthoscelides obtectus]
MLHSFSGCGRTSFGSPEIHATDTGVKRKALVLIAGEIEGVILNKIENPVIYDLTDNMGTLRFKLPRLNDLFFFGMDFGVPGHSTLNG